MRSRENNNNNNGNTNSEKIGEGDKRHEGTVSVYFTQEKSTIHSTYTEKHLMEIAHQFLVSN